MDRDLIKAAGDALGYILKDGPLPYTDVKIQCEKLGMHRGLLKAARKELGIKTINTGKTWLWYIPEGEEDA
ncbi:MAG: hypothetical protein ACYDG2_01775 [Ruminiclostridium sp.]